MLAFFSVGPLEIAVLAIIALLVLGPQRLPEAARSVGRGMREMRNALQGSDDEDGRHDSYDEDVEHEADVKVARDDEPEAELEDEPARSAT